MKNQNLGRIVIVCAVICAVIGGGYLLYAAVIKPSMSEHVSTSKDNVSTQDDNETATDDEAQQTYYYTLSMLITSYRVTYGVYPTADVNGWQHFLETSGSTVTDPYTGKPPVFTSDAPGVGEVQYVTPGTCSIEGPQLESAGRGTFAYRAHVAGSIMCYGNTSGIVR